MAGQRRRKTRSRVRASKPSRADTVALALAHGKSQARDLIAARDRRARRKAARAVSGLLVAEGDSWFDYPFCDILDELEDTFGYEVESVAHKGDTLEEMAYDATQLTSLARRLEKLGRDGRTPRALLLSAGGNDVAGEEFAVMLNHQQSGLPPLNESIVRGVLEERLLFGVVSVAKAVTDLARRYFGRPLPLVVHGYDYPVPDGRGFMGGFWVLPGPWLEPGFRQKGYDDLASRCAIIATLMDRFNAVLAKVPSIPELGHLTYVDLRRTLSSELAGKRYRQWWADELHPTPMGFREVAAKFDRAIRRFPMPS